MRSRALVFAIALIGAFAGGALAPPAASASVSIAATFDELVRDSSSAVLATPAEQRSVWEGGRIVTYTRVHVDRGVAGSLATGSETWVASLGGIVGDVGQVVDGEPQLHVGYPTFLFLRPDAAGGGLHVVTRRAQGQFHVRLDPATNRLRFVVPNALGAVIPSRTAPLTLRLASEVLAGRAVDEGASEIAAAWPKLHAK